MDRLDVYAPITKREKDTATGHLLVYGKITGPDLDRDQQRMDTEWLKTAVPDWFKTGNIREMHQLKAVGKAVQLEEKDDGWYVGARIVDKQAIEKVESGVLNGFSIGVFSPQVIKRADAPNGAVTGGRIGETSLVDSPSLATCLLTMAKADGAGELQPVESPELVEVVQTDPPLTKADVAELVKTAVAEAIAALPKPEPAAPAAEPEPVVKTDTTEPPTAPETLTKADVTALVTDALTEAMKPVQALVAKVEAMPTGGGPAITATATATADDKTARHRALLGKADAATDPNLAAGYREMAADLLKEKN